MKWTEVKELLANVNVLHMVDLRAFGMALVDLYNTE